MDDFFLYSSFLPGRNTLFLASFFNGLEGILEERVNKAYWKINSIYLSELLSLEIISTEGIGEDIL